MLNLMTAFPSISKDSSGTKDRSIRRFLNKFDNDEIAYCVTYFYEVRYSKKGRKMFYVDKIMCQNLIGITKRLR